jgi:hypothetical protein
LSYGEKLEIFFPQLGMVQLNHTKKHIRKGFSPFYKVLNMASGHTEMTGDSHFTSHASSKHLATTDQQALSTATM